MSIFSSQNLQCYIDDMKLIVFFFQQDNVLKHCSKLFFYSFRINNIKILQGTAHLADCNLIKNLWVIIKALIDTKKLKNFNEIKE